MFWIRIYTDRNQSGIDWPWLFDDIYLSIKGPEKLLASWRRTTSIAGKPTLASSPPFADVCQRVPTDANAVVRF